MALRGSMRDSAAQYLRPGEPTQAVIGGQTTSAFMAGPSRPVAAIQHNAPSPVVWAAEKDFRSFGRDPQ
jgi:hypothetical protein